MKSSPAIEQLACQCEHLSQEQINIKLIQACACGKVDSIRYLLTSPLLVNHAQLAFDNYAAFKIACQYGFPEVVNYLLIFMNANCHEKFHQLMDEGLQRACFTSNLSVVKFLLNSTFWTQEKKGYEWCNCWGQIFLSALQYKQVDILKYLIFDYGIAESESLKEIISKNPLVQEMFSLRRLNASLKEELPKNASPRKRVKI